MGQKLATATAQELVFDPVGMLAVLRRLSKLLAEEVALLKVMKIAQIHKLYNDKIELTTILEGYKETLAQNPELIERMPKRILAEIQAEAKKFEVLIEEDNVQINRAKEVHKIVMEAVRKVLEKSTIRSTGYNKNGVINMGQSGGYITPPVSVNENF